jgi:hypothetical protein
VGALSEEIEFVTRRWSNEVGLINSKEDLKYIVVKQWEEDFLLKKFDRIRRKRQGNVIPNNSIHLALKRW